MFAKGRYIGWLLGALCLIGQGCSSGAVQEAEHVVAQADSMRAEGGMYNDSVQLAKAYRTLHRRRAFYPDEYARCCYHYGRLLRNHDNPVAAMQVFINATHSGTKDYHILGRVYNNMGDICHLAGEFDLSYEMFERSANLFLRDGDTTAYYYILNDMAFELAGQGKMQETKNLLYKICAYKDSRLDALKALTMAKAFAENNQYDSVLYELNQSPEHYALHYVLKANAFWHIEKIDSALYYAKKVMTLPDASEQNKYNMLYIILNYDRTLRNDDIIALSAQRSDIETDVLIPLHNQWALAVQLLQQDLTRKPDFVWLYAVIATLAIVGGGIIIYVRRKHKKHGLLVQKVDELQQAAYAIQEKHDELKELYSTNHQYIEDDINNRCSMLQSNDKIKNTLAWKNYDKMCTIVDKQFYLLASKLRNKQCLNETEVRLCILTLLNCGYDQMAELLYHSATSIGTLKMRVAKKLGTTSKQLRQYLIDNECIR